MAKQKTSGKSRSNNKTNSRFTLQLGCCDSLHLYFPLSFQSPRFLSTLSVFTACKAWNIQKETSRGIDRRRRENRCSRTNTNWCQKLIARLKDKRASDKCLPALKEIWRKRLLRQKRHQSLKIIKREELSELNRAEIKIAALVFLSYLGLFSFFPVCLDRTCNPLSADLWLWSHSVSGEQSQNKSSAISVETWEA